MTNSEQVLLCIEEQDMEGAQLVLQKALTEDDEDVLLDLAAYLLGIGFLQEAEQVYKTLLLSYPEVAIQLAQISFEDGLVEEAFAYLEQIEPTSPAYLEALLTKADLYQAEGLADVAREKLIEAGQLSDHPLIGFGLAELEMELQDFKAAIAHYAALDNRQILEETGVSTYQRIGLAYASLGKFEVAIEFLEKAIELDYDDVTVFDLALLLFEQGEYQKANAYFKQLQAFSPDFEGYHYIYAQSLHGDHRTKEALDLLQSYLQGNAFDGAVLLLASQYAYELHDHQTAERYLLEAREVLEDTDEAILRLSSLYLEQERYDELVALEEQDLENVLARWHIAKGYVALERDQEAASLFDSLSLDLADNPEFLADYIDFLRQMGDLEQARLKAQHYLQLVPDDLIMQEFVVQE